MSKPVLVVGGGISGITIACEIADVGKEVILIERESYLGGNVMKMNNYFPKLCPPSCGLEINFRRIRQNSRITVKTETIIKTIEGQKGNFRITLQREPEYVNDRCTACGECEKVCPYDDRPDEFNQYLNATKCIFLPHEMSFPYRYAIDGIYCAKEECGKCAEVCPHNAINLKAEVVESVVEASSIVFATGWMPYFADTIENYNSGLAENIVTNVEMERLLAPNGPGNGKVCRPTDQKEPTQIIFVQCAGSRDENNLPYCSAVCCSASLKQALSFREKYPNAGVKIFYIDLRVAGRNEDFLVKVQSDPGIELIKGKVGKITEDKVTGNLFVEAEDIMSGRKIRDEAELVVLATGIMPSIIINTRLNRDQSGFLSSGQQESIYVAGCAKKPMDVASSLKDATGVALKAIQSTL